MDIKEMRLSTGLTQKKFAEQFGIPLGTLRRWEYAESTPAPYVVQLIARQLPIKTDAMKKITDSEGNVYFYDENASCLIDVRGTRIAITEDLRGVKEQNLGLYVQDLFEMYYQILERFHEDCRYDKKEDIIWS